MNTIQEIVSELEALGKSSAPLEELIQMAEKIRKKISSGMIPRGCKLNPIPSNYSEAGSKIGTLPSPYWVNVKSGQTLDLIAVNSSDANVVASVMASKQHEGSSVVTLVQKTSK